MYFDIIAFNIVVLRKSRFAGLRPLVGVKGKYKRGPGTPYLIIDKSKKFD